MSADYVSSCASSGSECHSDDVTSDAPVSRNRSCDVYVWGSNSSHQLAKGAQEKLTSPKQASEFVDVVEVCEPLTRQGHLRIAEVGFAHLMPKQPCQARKETL